MHAQEQAYIEGFVKRAMEHGFNENEAVELLKEAARGAGAARLAASPGIAPGRGTPDALRLAELSRQIRAHEKAKNPPIFGNFSRRMEADAIMSQARFRAETDKRLRKALDRTFGRRFRELEDLVMNR
jgi:hypothetical protein